MDTVLHDSGVGLWRVALSLTLLPVSVAFCVFRYRLFEIEVGIRRTLVYAVVSVALLLVYLGIVAVLDIPLFAAAVVAVAFAPVRDLVQRWLSHLLFGDRGDPSTALSALGRRLADSTDTPLDAAAPAVAVTLRLPAAAVVDDAGAVLSEYGSAPLDDAVFLLVNAGRTEGSCGSRAGPRTSRSCRPTVRCSPSSRGRWPRRWQPRAWTVKCAGPGRTWSPLARRSGAGCAGNCTTAWGRAWPPSAWSSISLGPCTPRRLRTEAGRRRLGPVPSRARCWVRCAGSCTNCGLRRWTNWAWWVRSRTSR